MHYYFSGTGIGAKDVGDNVRQLIVDTPHRLLSCFTAYTNFAHKWLRYVVEGSDPKRNTILLDSGAFTAWNQGSEVTLDTLVKIYWEFMWKYWEPVNEIYLINLDKIPGSPGRTPDAAEIAECERISDLNYKELVKLFGDRVLPVYHQGESEHRLRQVCDMGQYICVSPRNDLAEKYRVEWSREVHTKLPPEIKTHGLAATGISMMTTVPWYSVDSATYLMIAANGGVILCCNGKLIIVGASEKSSARHDAGQHISNLDEMTFKQAILPRIEANGMTVEQLANDYVSRIMISMREIQYWVDNCQSVKPVKVSGLFEL